MSTIKKDASTSDADAPIAAETVPATSLEASPGAEQAQDRSKVDLATAAIRSAGKGVWAGAAVGIGSAAIVAALLYTRKKG